uniref:Uncharacterized protein n=1 Tax=Anguilla anguilla TaxID=7936 RepID=A0A0E9TJ99_ANGAN
MSIMGLQMRKKKEKKTTVLKKHAGISQTHHSVFHLHLDPRPLE